ncbi:Uncharacterized protein Rs2_15264 [Raphanus sativus]|nr:Uncharacterized protein Rs2_15264 [Raphanus sativus]
MMPCESLFSYKAGTTLLTGMDFVSSLTPSPELSLSISNPGSPHLDPLSIKLRASPSTTLLVAASVIWCLRRSTSSLLTTIACSLRLLHSISGSVCVSQALLSFVCLSLSRSQVLAAKKCVMCFVSRSPKLCRSLYLSCGCFLFSSGFHLKAL